MNTVQRDDEVETIPIETQPHQSADGDSAGRGATSSSCYLLLSFLRWRKLL